MDVLGNVKNKNLNCFPVKIGTSTFHFNGINYKLIEINYTN